MNQPFGQMPALQRAAGTGRIAVRFSEHRTRLETIWQEGAAKIRLPRIVAGEGVEAVLINTAGGMTGGDCLDWRASAGANSRLTLTTQACEKVYKALAGIAAIRVTLEAGDHARLAWLPQETILFDRSALTRHIEADIAQSASLLMLEATVFGRQARGETVRDALFRDRWRIRCKGVLVHAEDVRLEGNAEALLAAAPGAAGGLAVATLALFARDAADKAELLRACLAAFPAVRTGVSGWQAGPVGKLLARFVAPDSYTLRKALAPAVRLLNDSAPLPKIWSL